MLDRLSPSLTPHRGIPPTPGELGRGRILPPPQPLGAGAVQHRGQRRPGGPGAPRCSGAAGESPSAGPGGGLGWGREVGVPQGHDPSQANLSSSAKAAQRRKSI